jgi:hypothetical protein
MPDASPTRAGATSSSRNVIVPYAENHRFTSCGGTARPEFDPNKKILLGSRWKTRTVTLRDIMIS